MTDKLGIVEFGRQTIQSGDLDPLYIALNRAEMKRSQLAKWMVAYWCLYHAGAASWLSEQYDAQFWGFIKQAAANDLGTSPVGKLWPRGKERRHWRGEAAVTSAQHMFGRFNDAGTMLNFVINEEPDKLNPNGASPTNLMRRVQTITGFGPWIAFKVADMVDAADLRNLDFSQAAVFMFEQPQEAALAVWRQQLGLPDTARPRDQAAARDGVVTYLLEQFADLQCPHKPSRGIRLQEVETVLCKWKSHVNGHYPIGNDIREIGDGLEPWTAESQTASRLLDIFGELHG